MNVKKFNEFLNEKKEPNDKDSKDEKPEKGAKNPHKFGTKEFFKFQKDNKKKKVNENNGNGYDISLLLQQLKDEYGVDSFMDLDPNQKSEVLSKIDDYAETLNINIPDAQDY